MCILSQDSIGTNRGSTLKVAKLPSKVKPLVCRVLVGEARACEEVTWLQMAEFPCSELSANNIKPVESGQYLPLLTTTVQRLLLGGNKSQ